MTIFTVQLQRQPPPMDPLLNSTTLTLDNMEKKYTTGMLNCGPTSLQPGIRKELSDAVSPIN